MRMAETYSIGVDLGGTNLRAAAISRDGNILERIAGQTPIQEGPRAVVTDIAVSVESLRRRFGDRNLQGIGIGVPGFIRMETGVIAGWGNAPAFNGYPIRDEIEKALYSKLIPPKV